ncbi:3-deoxy-7-phosphoheptulonate synthase [Streptomyces sp. 7-21]|uniref:3-deoxy-7-phosphoheptulonate synthase n=1 Tax=Streptomyces sp. 7-21 TaxID=2802283 RepID=UPI00191E9E68|nr:3-deoxy-7-phosphoheptulonate synthase [Streptomyces sp. 7-21]MBL1065943.1 3-deoxy-7-phosphoheptulonate synthase [Streptomyces sp. 7-21]
MSTTRLLIATRAVQQPDWTRWDELDAVLGELTERPPLVSPAVPAALTEELAFVARGSAFVIQTGDCAELFADSSPERVRAKANELHRLADLFESLTKLPVVRIGRLAGQYAKPRSNSHETLPDGTVLPVYRGDAVNSAEATEAARQPDPQRLLAAYDHARQALDTLATHYPARPGDASGQAVRAALAPTYTSHEALLLEYEHALTRADERGGRYGSSAPFLWIGERTRQLDHAHVEYAAAISNPVGVKIGPRTEPSEVASLIERLNPAGQPGRLALIVRMGAASLPHRLPPLLSALGPLASRAIWLIDPMHGNTKTNAAGQKTRVLDDVLAETEAFFAALGAHGLPPGGLHLETAPDDVTECVAHGEDLDDEAPLPRYESACDPRLSPAQSERVVRLAASLVTRRSS